MLSWRQDFFEDPPGDYAERGGKCEQDGQDSEKYFYRSLAGKKQKEKEHKKQNHERGGKCEQNGQDSEEYFSRSFAEKEKKSSTRTEDTTREGTRKKERG